MPQRSLMSRNAVLTAAVMLAAAFQFLVLSVVLLRPEFGWRDAVFSMGNAAAMSFVVSGVFCVPAVLRVTAIGPLTSYLISYVLGFLIVALILSTLTTTLLGWPREEIYSVSVSETLHGAILLTAFATPLAALGAVVVGVSSWLMPTASPRDT